MQLRTLDDLGGVKGKRVLVRVDFNVPMDGAQVVDDTKIRLTLPTITQLLERGASLVLCSHLGEGGSRDTLEPVAAHLQNMVRDTLKKKMPGTMFLRERIGAPALIRKLNALRGGSIALLENIRWYSGETANSPTFARALAKLGDVYVNDAFGVSHRAHASLALVPTFLPSAAGLLLEREVSVLSHLLEDPASPFVALMGGAKIATKAPVIERLIGVADTVLLGGALASTFFAARGYAVGNSLVEASGIAAARRLLRIPKRRNLILPIDVVVGSVRGKQQDARVVPISGKPHQICAPPFAILDIGPATIRAYSQQLKSAATIVWNGPMGMFERPPFHHGSVILARLIATRSSGRAFGVVGGGETLAVLARTKMERYIDHVSSGGGAMLAFLAGEEMPGLVALRVNH